MNSCSFLKKWNWILRICVGIGRKLRSSLRYKVSLSKVKEGRVKASRCWQNSNILSECFANKWTWESSAHLDNLTNNLSTRLFTSQSIPSHLVPPTLTLDTTTKWILPTRVDDIALILNFILFIWQVENCRERYDRWRFSTDSVEFLQIFSQSADIDRLKTNRINACEWWATTESSIEQ